jgi:hypothetical protein
MRWENLAPLAHHIENRHPVSPFGAQKKTVFLGPCGQATYKGGTACLGFPTVFRGISRMNA